MKRILFSLCVAAIGLSSVSADTYNDALLSYMKYGNAVDQQQYEKMLQPIVLQLFPNDVEGATAAFSDYASTRMMADLVELYEPAFRKHVSEEELQQLIATYSDPRFSEIQKRSASLVQNFSQSGEYQQFADLLAGAIGDIMLGKQPQNMPVPDSISPDYLALFNRYYVASGTNKIIEQTFSAMTGMMENAMKKNNVQNAQTIIQNIVAYIQLNMPTVLAALFSKALSADDLQMLINSTDSEAYKHSIDAVAEVVSNPMQLGIDLIDKMSDWMSVHHPTYAAPLQETVKAMKKM